MARLTIQNVAAPNLSGTSQILANAAASLNNGLGVASGILEKYNAGQQESADASVLSEIAKISSEDELGSFLGSGQLDGLNLSPKMREKVLGLRQGILGNNQTRAQTRGTDANTASTRASTTIRQAAEGRDAAEYKDKVGVRTEKRALTRAIIAANAEGVQRGRPTHRNEVANAAYQGLIDRGLPAHVAEGFVMNFEDESGFVPDRVEGAPNVHGTRGKGIYQLTGSRRDAYEQRYGQDYSLNNQLDWLVSELQGSESSAGQRILNTNTAGEAGAAIVTNFLRPAEKFRAERAARYLNSPRSNMRPAFKNLQQELGNSNFLDSKYATERLADARAAQTTGQSRIDRDNKVAQQNITDALIIEAARNPKVNTRKDMIDHFLNNPDVGDATQQLNIIDQALKRVGEGGSLDSVFRPPVPTSPVIQDAVELSRANNQKEIEFSAQKRIYDRASNFERDPAGELIREFDLTNQGWFSSLTKEELTKEINTLSDELGVTPAIVAAAMAENRDVDWLPGNDVNDNFSLEDTRAFIKDNLSKEALSRFKEKEIVINARQKQISGLVLELNGLRSRAKKSGSNVPPGLTKEIKRIEDQIYQLTGKVTDFNLNTPNPTTAADVISASSTPDTSTPVSPSLVPEAQEPSSPNPQISSGSRERLLAYIQETGLQGSFSKSEANSPDRTRAIEVLIENISNDTTLTDAEKQNLLAAITGVN